MSEGVRSGSLTSVTRKHSAPKEVAEGGPGPAGNGHEVLLQAFNWENSVSKEGYLPRDLENLNSHYGSEAELRTCIRALQEHKLHVVADIVINHRCANTQGETGKWNRFAGRYAWDHSAVCKDNVEFEGTGAPKQGEDFAAAPNIDHTNEVVRRDLKAWLQHLKSDVRFQGWRFDFVKGYPGGYVKEYIEATQPHFAVGEFWDTCEYDKAGELLADQDPHRQRTIDWIDATGGKSAAFDFTTKAVLQEAIAKGEYWRLRDRDGKPPGLIGWWPSRSVTFLDNHDTGSTQNHWPFPQHGLHEGHAYILTHPGTPCLFYDHLWTDGMAQLSLWRRVKHLMSKRPRHNGNSFRLLRPLRLYVMKLIQIRQRHGIGAGSDVCIREAKDTVYAATVDDKIAIKIGPGAWNPNTAKVDVGQKAWLMALSGFHFAVWEAKF
ncbi:hypothetical protein WJX72_011679 [[Myrmecia] bisecta]|uniref:alpha-amylase n=1 Tax=[Myrmecia] bisecta TaxID=41462 RepID=A0AAW1P608_9CHLO